MSRLILHITFFLLLSFVVFGQTVYCDFCKSQIKEKYISFEGKLYHEECYKDHIQLRCFDCGKGIDGKYITYKQKVYHENCYKKNVALKCDLCGEIIDGSFISDYWGNNYHSFHADNEPRCDYCKRFISGKLTKGGSRYNDGRVICTLCEENSVKSLAKGETILNKVRISLKNLGVGLDNVFVNLKLVDKQELQQVAAGEREVADTRGFSQYTYYRRGAEISDENFTIYLLNGMPEKVYEAVAAHELMHVWQYINSPDNLDLKIAEGSAEYISYLHMKKQYDDYSKFTVKNIEDNRDPIYGEGFREIKRIVDRKGLNYLLDYISKSN